MAKGSPAQLLNGWSPADLLQLMKPLFNSAERAKGAPSKVHDRMSYIYYTAIIDNQGGKACPYALAVLDGLLKYAAGGSVPHDVFEATTCVLHIV